MSLVILDRDGVINEDTGGFIKSAEECVPIPGSIEAIARLCQAGFTPVVATNQSGLGRGLFDLDDLEAMHAKLTQLVEAEGGSLGGIFYCPHHPDDDCKCRKPKPGILEAIEAEFNTSVQGRPFIGDSLRDLQAGEAKGCQPILVRTGNGEATLKALAEGEAKQFSKEVPSFANLAEAVDYLIQAAQQEVSSQSQASDEQADPETKDSD